VSDALIFLNYTHSEFSEALPTTKFCKIFNIFDLMNSRRKFRKNETEECITIENLLKIEKNINNYINYIKSLKLANKKNNIVIVREMSRICNRLLRGSSSRSALLGNLDKSEIGL